VQPGRAADLSPPSSAVVLYIYIYIYIYKEGKIFTARYTPCAITLEHRVVTWNI